MSIIMPDADEPVFEGLVPANAPQTPPPAEELPPAAEDTPPAEPDMFPRDYVEELRQEAAKYRTQLRDYEQKFDGYTDEERSALLDYVYLTRQAEAGNEEAARQLQEMFGEQDETPAPEPVQQFDEETFRRLAREEAERLVAEQAQAQAQQQAVQNVQTRAKELGYEAGTEDYVLLMKFANDVDPADNPDLIAAGHEKVQAYKQAIIDAHLAQIQAQNDQIPVQPTTPGVAPSQATPPRTFEEARQALHERLLRGT